MRNAEHAMQVFCKWCGRKEEKDRPLVDTNFGWRLHYDCVDEYGTSRKDMALQEQKQRNPGLFR